MPNLKCRFYEQHFPNENDPVMIKVLRIDNFGVNVHLLEYDIEGMIILSELSRKRIRVIHKFVKIGRTDVAIAVRIDGVRRSVDLSKKRATIDDIKKCTDNYNRNKGVNQIVNYAASKLNYQTNEELEDLMTRTAWYFDRKYDKVGISYEIFRRAATDPTILQDCDLKDEERKALQEVICNRLSPQPKKLRADIKIQCFDSRGVVAIKEALMEGMEASSESMPIKINLIAPPRYVITTQTLKLDQGVAAIQDCIERIEKYITAYDSFFEIDKMPWFTSDQDDDELLDEFMRAENATKGVSADDEILDSMGTIGEGDKFDDSDGDDSS